MIKVELLYPNLFLHGDDNYHGNEKAEKYLSTRFALSMGRKPDVPYYSVWSQEIDSLEDPIQVLETMFELFNVAVPRPVGCRSMSVGDVVKIGDTFYHCDMAGWSEVEAPNVEPALSFGW